MPLTMWSCKVQTLQLHVFSGIICIYRGEPSYLVQNGHLTPAGTSELRAKLRHKSDRAVSEYLQPRRRRRAGRTFCLSSGSS